MLEITIAYNVIKIAYTFIYKTTPNDNKFANKLVKFSDIGATGGAIAVKEYVIGVTKAKNYIAEYENGIDGGKKCINDDSIAMNGENNIVDIGKNVLYCAIISYININPISTKVIKTLGV